MAYMSRRSPVEHVYADKVVWQCTSCTCWSRKEYVLEDEPHCPMCQNKMTEVTKNIRVE